MLCFSISLNFLCWNFALYSLIVFNWNFDFWSDFLCGSTLLFYFPKFLVEIICFFYFRKFSLLKFWIFCSPEYTVLNSAYLYSLNFLRILLAVLKFSAFCFSLGCYRCYKCFFSGLLQMLQVFFRAVCYKCFFGTVINVINIFFRAVTNVTNFFQVCYKCYKCYFFSGLLQM